MSASSITFVGAWVRFRGVKPKELAYIHSPGNGTVRNAVWLPSGASCSVRVPFDLDQAVRAKIVPENEVPDRMWAALAAWRLTQ